MIKLTSVHFVNGELVIVCNECNPEAHIAKPMWSMDESGSRGITTHLSFVHPELVAYAV